MAELKVGTINKTAEDMVKEGCALLTLRDAKILLRAKDGAIGRKRVKKGDKVWEG